MSATETNGLVARAADTLVPANMSIGAMERAIAMGDLSKMDAGERLAYVGAICKAVGLNPLTRPIEYVTLQGKITLYANKGCAEQLRQIHGISIEIVDRRHESGCVTVRVKGTTRDGRQDESLGAVPLVDGAKGEAVANAWMKAETKAKRRVTLSLVGLGILDVSELDTVEARQAAPAAPSHAPRPGAADLNAALGIKKVVNTAAEPMSVPTETESDPEPEPSQAVEQPQSPAIPECPADFGDATGWRQAMVEAIAAKGSKDAAKAFDKGLAANGCTSYLATTPDQRRQMWARLHGGT